MEKNALHFLVKGKIILHRRSVFVLQWQWKVHLKTKTEQTTRLFWDYIVLKHNLTMRFFLHSKKNLKISPPTSISIDFILLSHISPHKNGWLNSWIFPPPSLWWPHVPSNGLRMHADSVGSSLAIPEVLLYWIPLPLHQHPSRKWRTPDLCFVTRICFS